MPQGRDFSSELFGQDNAGRDLSGDLFGAVPKGTAAPAQQKINPVAPGLSDEQVARNLGFSRDQWDLIRNSASYRTVSGLAGSGLSPFINNKAERTNPINKATDWVLENTRLGTVGKSVLGQATGLGQMVVHGLNSAGVVSDADKLYNDLVLRTIDADYQWNARGGQAPDTLDTAIEVATGFITPGPKMAIKGVGKLNTTASGAVTGAANASMQPVIEGKPEDYWREKGNQAVTGAAIGGALGGTLELATSRAAKGRKPLSNQVDESAVRYADENDVPIPLSVRTGSKLAQNYEARAQNVMGSADYARKAVDNTRNALERKGRKLAEETSPGMPVSPERGGETVIEGFQEYIRSKNTGANQEYAAFHKFEQHPGNVAEVPVGMKKMDAGIVGPDGQPVTREIPVTAKMPLPVDMREIKEALRPVAERYKYTLPQTDQRASQGLKAIENIINGPDYKPASAAELDLGMLKEAARTDMPELRDISQGMAAHAVSKFQQSIDETVSSARVGGADAYAALQKGRKLTAEKWAAADLQKELGPAGRLEPVQVFQKLTWSKDSGVERLRKVADIVGPERMREVGRAYVEGLLETATREGDFEKAKTIFSQWHQLGPETKKVLFGNPMLVDKIDKFLHLAKRLSDDPNPSGSAKLVATELGGTLIIQNPVRGMAYAVGNRVIAQMLYSPKWSKRLATMMDGRAGAASAGAVRDILHTFGKNLVPVEAGAGRMVARPGGSATGGAVNSAEGWDRDRDDVRARR